MKSSRNSFGMMFLSRFIILQSVVTRYLFVQKVVNCCHSDAKSQIGYGDTGQGLAFMEMDGLLFTDIDIVILALTFQEDDRRVGLDDFPLLGQELEDFPVFRRPQGQAVFLDFQLLEPDLELIALLDQRFPVVTLVGNGLPLFFDLRQLEGITVSRIDGTAQ